MRRTMMLASMLGLALAGFPLLAGCDETVEHQREVEVKDDGTQVTEEKKVTKDPDTGETTVTEKKEVDAPNDR